MATRADLFLSSFSHNCQYFADIRSYKRRIAESVSDAILIYVGIDLSPSLVVRGLGPSRKGHLVIPNTPWQYKFEFSRVGSDRRPLLNSGTR